MKFTVMAIIAIGITVIGILVGVLASQQAQHIQIEKETQEIKEEIKEISKVIEEPIKETIKEVPTPKEPICDKSYPDVCIPPYPPDLDCGQVLPSDFTVLQPDPHGFDDDKDGIGCEN